MARINYSEFISFTEIPLLIKLRLKKIFTKKTERKGKILIINTSIIGDFLASLPALISFLNENRMKADIIVAPNLKTLSERIRGIGKVFTAKSLYERETEKVDIKRTIPDDYKKLIIIRMSPNAYKFLDSLHFSDIKIYDFNFYGYVINIIKHSLFATKLKQMRTLYFEIFGVNETKRKVVFEDIFKFTKEDYLKINKIKDLKDKKKIKKVIIHVGSGWEGKLWENDNWINLLEKINSERKFKFFFVGGTSEEEKSFSYIKNRLNFKIFSLIKKLDLKDLLLVMRKCDYFIGNDSGPRNLAHLANLRSITLVGPVLKNFMPIDKRDIILDRPDPFSVSLFYLGKGPMKKITVDEVFKAFKKLEKSH